MPDVFPLIAENNCGTVSVTRTVIHQPAPPMPVAVGIVGVMSLTTVTFWREFAVEKPFCCAYRQAVSTGLAAVVTLAGHCIGVLLQVHGGLPQLTAEIVELVLKL